MIQPLPGTACIFGEAPVWDASAEQLYWLDCLAPALLRLHPASGRVERVNVELPCPATGLVRAADGCLIVISSEGLFRVDPEAQRISPIPLRSAVPLKGANDGKCDRQGRLWLGTGDGGGERPPGHLLKVGLDLRVDVVDAGLSIPNGPAFSADGTRMYLADSAAGQIYRYLVEPTSGALGTREIFASFPEGNGAPDGMAVDEADYLWVALYDGSALCRFTPWGVLERRLNFEASRITSCAFGGPGLNSLFATSAVQDWTLPAGAGNESADTLFRIAAPVCGIAEQPFAGVL